MWDETKNEWLKRDRFISFEEIAAIIQDDEYIDVVENPARPGQQCVLLRIRAYIWMVPYVIDEQDRVVLKTAYPSRKYNRIYGD